MTKSRFDKPETMALKDHPLIVDLLSRVDAIERRVGLGKYAPYDGKNYAQRLHGERVEHRQKVNS